MSDSVSAINRKGDGATMRRSWLVQRLQRPYPHDSILGRDNPFAFGGGRRNGGLSDEAMGLLRGCFSFDYMGAAEFEFGAVPKALEALAKDAKRVIAYLHFLDDQPVYVICRKDHATEVNDRITGWATERYSDLKEQTRLSSALNPKDEWDTKVCGWLELDNGFFFFTDEDMWEATAHLFGAVEVVDSGHAETPGSSHKNGSGFPEPER